MNDPRLTIIRCVMAILASLVLLAWGVSWWLVLMPVALMMPPLFVCTCQYCASGTCQTTSIQVDTSGITTGASCVDCSSANGSFVVPANSGLCLDPVLGSPADGDCQYCYSFPVPPCGVSSQYVWWWDGTTNQLAFTASVGGAQRPIFWTIAGGSSQDCTSGVSLTYDSGRSLTTYCDGSASSASITPI